MAKVIVGRDEPFEAALRRFKKQILNDGTLLDYRKHEYYKSKSTKRREKSEEARRRALRKNK